MSQDNQKVVANCQVGIIGLSTMGSNLALNLASKGIKTAVYNRSFEKTQKLLDRLSDCKLLEVLKNHNTKDNIFAYDNLKNFVLSLQKPRKIILLVKSGQAVDETIEQILIFLEEGDFLIDMGNSNWKDTQRRQKEFCNSQVKKNIYFIGCGISGGEEGALKGASIMPGGEKEAVEKILPLLKQISARDFQNQPCVTNIGLGASGHFVKMVHNGIEYALMQAIAEIYHILKYKNFDNLEIARIFEQLNEGELQSYLLEITIKILQTKDSESDLDLTIEKGEVSSGFVSTESLSEKKQTTKIYQEANTKFNLVFDIYGVICKDDLLKTWIEPTLKFIQENSHKYNFYFLSNLGMERLAVFKSSQIYTYFSGGYGSAEIDLYKPDLQAFDKLLRDFNLQIEQTIFIDDNPRNVQAAQKIGLKTILFDSQFTDLQKEVEKFTKNLNQNLTNYLIDKIFHKAEAKGTGSWTVQSALDLGIPTPSIVAAVFARNLSAKKLNFALPKQSSIETEVGSKTQESGDLLYKLKKILYLSYLASFLQGVDLILEANKQFDWQIDLSKVLQVWQGGCIIRSKILDRLAKSFQTVLKELDSEELNLQTEMQWLATIPTPKPVIHSVYDYLLSIQSSFLPSNLIQAQRDYFGSHGYQRIDKQGIFTGGWIK